MEKCDKFGGFLVSNSMMDSVGSAIWDLLQEEQSINSNTKNSFMLIPSNYNTFMTGSVLSPYTFVLGMH